MTPPIVTNVGLSAVIFGVEKVKDYVVLGKVELAELDGPFVKIRLKGRFWHKRSTVLARVSNYLKQRIPVSHISAC